MKEKVLNALKWFFKSYIWLGVLILAIDIITKQIILGFHALEGDLISDWGFVRIRFILNRGAAFGMGTGNAVANRVLYLVIASLISIGLVTYLIIKRKDVKAYVRASLIMVVTGAIGNMIDRIFYAPEFAVVDWIDFYWVPGWVWVFNIADSCIVVAAFMLIIYVIVGEVKEYKAKNKTTVKTVNDNKKILSKTEKERLEAEQAQEKESK